MKNGSKECPHDSPVFTAHSMLQIICLLRKSSNISRKVFGPVVGSIMSPQPLILPYFSLYFFPESTLRTSCNVSKKISEPVVGSVGSPQTLILLYFSLYFP